MSNNWETGICGCFDVKDCGIGCCCKLYCVRPAPESTHSCAKKLSRNQQATFQPLTSPFIPYGVPLAHGRCACALPRAAQGSPCVWGAAMEKAGLGSCFGCCLGVYCCTPCVICQVLQE